MGVSLYIDSYKKEEKHIRAEVKSLGIYEVNLEEIESNSSPFRVDFRGTIYSFQELAWNKWKVLMNNEVYTSRTKIAFFDLIPSPMTGDNIIMEDGKPIGPMFDPRPILELTEAVLKSEGWLVDCFDPFIQEQIHEYEEFKRLKQLKQLLNEAIENDYIIGMSIG